MIIYDRWGGVVFQTNDIEKGWDGYNNQGYLSETGAYLYHISLSDYNERVWVYSGKFQLFR